MKPGVKRGKTDAAGAEAINEAVTFAPTESRSRSADHAPRSGKSTLARLCRALLRRRIVGAIAAGRAGAAPYRDLLVRQWTMLVNALRGNMAELGIIAPLGISRVGELVAMFIGDDETRLSALARQALRSLASELDALGRPVYAIEAFILALHKDNEASRRLAAVGWRRRDIWSEAQVLQCPRRAGVQARTRAPLAQSSAPSSGGATGRV